MRVHILLLLILGVSACTRVTVFGHTVKDGAASDSATAARNLPAAQQAQLQVSRIKIEFTPEVKQQADADNRFDADALRDAINAELLARGLLAQQSTGVGRVAVIQLDEFSVRATSNVVLFGRLPSAGVLAGAISIREAGHEVPEFRVRADIALNITQRDTDKQPLQNLYKRFAALLADKLVGAALR